MWKRVAIVGAVLAAAVAVAISNDCRHNDWEDDCPGDWPDPNMLTTVLAATQDIPRGSSMDSAIKDGHIVEIAVPTEAFDEGTATEVAQIESRSITIPIRRNEQIPLDSLRWTVPKGTRPER